MANKPSTVTEAELQAFMAYKAEKAALLAENARLKAEAEARDKAQIQKLTCKVSAKGALSVYGLGRWPVTLYKSQWIALLSIADGIREFIKTNDAVLTTKGE
jgi:hypothetical protein